MSGLTFRDQLGVIEVTKDEYISKCVPERMGNILPIAYGGCTTAIAVYAACQTVDDSFHIFSVLGSFHGPTKIDRKVKCHVSRTRQTRTFATRRAVAYQTQDDGSQRTCAEIFVDFHVSEAGMYEYSAPPSQEYCTWPQDPLELPPRSEIIRKLVEDGYTSEAEAEAQLSTFAEIEKFVEIRDCWGSVSGQTAMGIAANVVTTQDHLPIYDKVSSEWIRTKELLNSEADHIAALAFSLDGGLSFLPLNHNNRAVATAGPASTLDFALRILVPEVKVDSWLLRERKTIAASGAKAYSESRVWNKSGRMVAVMTQMSICRPPKQSNKEGPKL